MKIISWTLPSPAAVPEGTVFLSTDKLETPKSMDVWQDGKLFTCSWEPIEGGYIMVMTPSEDQP